LTQTFLHSKLFPCIHTADNTFGKFVLPESRIILEVAEIPTFLELSSLNPCILVRSNWLLRGLALHLRHKLALMFAVALVVLGVVGLSSPVQAFLISQLPPQNNPIRSFNGTWRVGLAPYLYCFVPDRLRLCGSALGCLPPVG
jgi:hypothetical protein